MLTTETTLEHTVSKFSNKRPVFGLVSIRLIVLIKSGKLVVTFCIQWKVDVEGAVTFTVIVPTFEYVEPPSLDTSYVIISDPVKLYHYYMLREEVLILPFNKNLYTKAYLLIR